MEVSVKELTFEELIDLYKAMEEFVEFLEVEESTEIESRKK